MGYMRFGRFFAILTIFLVSSPAFVSAMTWYVDPVNGSDAYTGDNPFARPEFGVGPKQTLDGVTGVVNDFDLVVLMDGVYSGPMNDDPGIFNFFDWKRLYVVSANGAEHCTIQLSMPVQFNNFSPAPLDTFFEGITFAHLNVSGDPIFEFTDHSRVRFKNCVFTGFKTTYSHIPALELIAASAWFENCTFTANDIAVILSCHASASVELSNCRFTGNRRQMPSSSLSLVRASQSFLTVRDCLFANNSCFDNFRAIDATENCDLQVQGCVIENNVSTHSLNEAACAGIRTGMFTRVTVSDTRFENLSCETPEGRSAVGLYVTQPENVSVWNCKFKSNNAGIVILSQGPYAANVNIDCCEFIDNTAASPYVTEFSGGIYLGTEASALIVDINESTFRANLRGIYQRGFWSGEGRVRIDHCLFTEHRGPRGVIELQGAPDLDRHQINHCTLANNSAMALRAAFTDVRNSILRDADPIEPLPGLIINYSNVEHWTGAGVGNIDVDPLFANPGYWDEAAQAFMGGTDYHLKSTAGRWDPAQEMWVVDDVDSPCIDAGDPADVPFFEPTGSGGRVNMGVYGNTWQASMSDVCFGSGWRGSGMMFSDINNDCVVNLADYAVMASEWLDSTLADLPILY